MFKRYSHVWYITVLIAYSFALFSCSAKSHTCVTPGVYYWKTIFNPEAEERKWLEENRVKKLYLRMFDVDWNESLKEPIPVGVVQIKSSAPKSLEIIPVIFITNRTLLFISDSSVNTLAARIAGKITAKMKESFVHAPKEIQLDCDWTEKTRDKYFNLIRNVKKYSECKIISATIRLHQVKYFRKTGVPPADRGMLMFYNMSSVDNVLDRNSIFDLETAKKYLYNFDKYPLKLDVVLPAFSWGALFRRGKLIRLINELSLEQLKFSGFFKESTPNQFICTDPIAINGIRILKNDLIRNESISTETTESAARLISNYLKEDTITVALYHLNKEVVRKYEKTKLQGICSFFN